MFFSQQKFYWTQTILVVLCFCLNNAPVGASESISSKNSKFLVGGVKGKATLRPSLILIQPDEAKRSISGYRDPQIDGSYPNFQESFNDNKEWLRKLKRERRKRRNRIERNFNKRQGGYISPITSYEYSVNRQKASTPQQRFTVDKSEYVDALWIRSLSNNILKNPNRSYIPRFARVGFYENKEKRKT